MNFTQTSSCGEGGKLGTMLKVDQLTSFQARGQYARICVEIDLTKKLVSKIEVLGHTLLLEYEGLHSICFSCGRVGHKADKCMERPMGDTQGDGSAKTRGWTTAPPPDNGTIPILGKEGAGNPEDPRESRTTNLEDTDGISGNTASASYDPWMIVKRGNRRRPNSGKGSRITQGIREISGGDYEVVGNLHGTRFGMLDNNEEGPTDEHVSRERYSSPVTEDQSKQLVVRVQDPKAGRNS